MSHTPRRPRSLSEDELENILRDYKKYVKRAKPYIYGNEIHSKVLKRLENALHILNDIKKRLEQQHPQISLDNLLNSTNNLIEEIKDIKGFFRRIRADMCKERDKGEKLVDEMLNNLRDLQNKLYDLYNNPLDVNIQNIKTYMDKIIIDLNKTYREIENICKVCPCDVGQISEMFNNVYNLISSSLDPMAYAILLDHIRVSLRYGKRDILKTVTLLTGIPVEVIRHKPVDNVELCFGECAQYTQNVEVIDLLHSLTPFSIIQKGGKKFIFLPHKVDGKLISVPGDSDEQIEIIQPVTIKLIPIDHYSKYKFKKYIFEVSELLEREPYFSYCKRGILPVITSERCPLLRSNMCFFDSRNVGAEGGQCEYFYGADVSYRRAYHIEPITKKQVVKREEQAPYYELPGNISISQSKVDVYYAIEKVVFIPKHRNIKVEQYPKLDVRVCIKDENSKSKCVPLGFVVKDTNALVVRFPSSYLEELVKFALDNSATRNWLCIKYKTLKKRGNLFEKINDVFSQLPALCDKEELVKFSMEVFVHSFAHILLNVLSAELNIEHLYHLDYLIRSNKDVFELYIYELANGGYGLLEEDLLKRVFGDSWPLKILIEVGNAGHLVRSHIEKVNKEVESTCEQKNLPLDLTTEKIWRERICKPYKSYGVYEPAYALRVELWKSEVDVNSIEFVLDNLAPVCMDACSQCVMLEKGCNYALEQVTKVSSNLFVYATKKMLQDLQMFFENLLSDKNTRENALRDLLGMAKTRLDIAVYVVDKYGASILKELKQSNALLNIRILLDSRTVQDSDIIKELRNAGIEVRVKEHVHSKIYIIDGKFAVVGSANLTLYSLKENYENFHVVFQPEEVEKRMKEFETLWASASP